LCLSDGLVVDNIVITVSAQGKDFGQYFVAQAAGDAFIVDVPGAGKIVGVAMGWVWHSSGFKDGLTPDWRTVGRRIN